MICDICGKEFTSTSANLRRHRRLKHNIVENVEYNVKCMESMCNFSCSKLGNLRHHLETTHGILQEVDELQFNNIEEFNKWKAAEETRCVALWVKRHGNARQKYPTIHYYCNRSGKKRLLSADQRSRKIKKQGSCKIDCACTSAIIVKIISGCIKVKYYKSHYRHDNELDYIPLPDDAKSMIAAQLMQGISPKGILTKFRNSTETVVERLRLISKSDINNIIREFNLYDLGKDRVTTKVNRIIMSHKDAENSKNTFTIKYENCWRVLSGNENYLVKINLVEENHICKLKCPSCLACVHIYSCTCLDFMMYSNMCKHIHSVCINEASEKNRQETLQEIEKVNAERQLHAIQDKIRKTINSIFIMSDWNSISDQVTLSKINGHLTSALKLINHVDGSPSGNEETLSASTDEKRQLPFSSTNILIVPATQLMQVEETSKILQKYRPIVPRVNQPLEDVENVASDKSDQASRILQSYRPIVPRLTMQSLEEIKIIVSESDDVEEPHNSVQTRRPNILAKSAKKLNGFE